MCVSVLTASEYEHAFLVHVLKKKNEQRLRKQKSLLHSWLSLLVLCFLDADLLTQGLVHLRQALHYCLIPQTHLSVCCFCIQEKHFLVREAILAPIFPNSVHGLQSIINHKFSYLLGYVWPTVFTWSLKKKSHIRVTRGAVFNTNMQQLGGPSRTNRKRLDSQGLSQAFVLSRHCHRLNTSHWCHFSLLTRSRLTQGCVLLPPAWCLPGS